MLNDQRKKNYGIGWTDFTWNPISGCLHGCTYCYLKRIEKRFKNNLMEPKFNHKALLEPCRLKKRSKIFVGSSGDMWGRWVSKELIVKVLNVCFFAEKHTFQFLTKNPSRYKDFYLPFNAWYGTTVDGTSRTEKNTNLLLDALSIDRIPGRKTFISFEPLLKYPKGLDLKGIDWIIIGADSTPGAKKPPIEWADGLIKQARNAGAAIWIKNNYNYPKIIREFPEKQYGI